MLDGREEGQGDSNWQFARFGVKGKAAVDCDSSVLTTSKQGVAHCDASSPNILMLSLQEALQKVTDAGDGIVLGRETLMKIPLGQCTFLLNDWGNAKILNVSTALRILRVIFLVWSVCSSRWDGRSSNTYIMKA